MQSVIGNWQRMQTGVILDTIIYTEITKTFQYLDQNSAHPLATFKGLIEGEF